MSQQREQGLTAEETLIVIFSMPLMWGVLYSIYTYNVNGANSAEVTISFNR
jgi:hypothetical protein